MPEVAAQLPGLRAGLGIWTAWSSGPLPDQPPDALIRVLGHQDMVLGVAISPDGTWIATASLDRTVRTWAADGTRRAVLTGHQAWVYRVAIFPDGTWLASTGGDRTVRIWAADGTRAVTAIRVDGTVSACAWFPASTDLCMAGHQGLYRLSLEAPPD